MAVARCIMGNDGTLDRTEGGPLLPVTAGATAENWVIFNETNKAIRVSFNRSGSDITADFDISRNHNNTIVRTQLAIDDEEFITVPAWGAIKGVAVNADGTNAGMFGIRDIVTEHGTSAVEGDSVWFFLN